MRHRVWGGSGEGQMEEVEGTHLPFSILETVKSMVKLISAMITPRAKRKYQSSPTRNRTPFTPRRNAAENRKTAQGLSIGNLCP